VIAIRVLGIPEVSCRTFGNALTLAPYIGIYAAAGWFSLTVDNTQDVLRLRSVLPIEVRE
jgi:hypothetical protein